MPLHLAWSKPSDKISCAPVLAGDVLVVAAIDDMGHAVLQGWDIYENSKRWEHKISHEINELVTCNGTVFFEGHAADFFNEPMGGPAKSDPPDLPKSYDVDPHAENVTVETIGVLALDVGSGRLKSAWYHVAKLGDVKHFYVDTDVLVVTTANSGVVAYDVHSAKELWKRKDFQARNDQNIESSLKSLPSVAVGFGHGAIFLAQDRTVTAINIRSGKTRWTHHSSSDLRQDTPPQVGNGLVIVLDVEKAFALDWESGKPVWESPAGSEWNTPAVCWEGDCLFFTTKNGKAGILELRTGKEYQTYTLQDMINNAGQQLLAPQFKQGTFFPPVILGPASQLICARSQSYEANVVFATTSGAVFNFNLQVDQSNPNADFKDKAPAFRLAKVIPYPKGLRFTPVGGDGIYVLTDVDNICNWNALTEENYAARFVNRNSSNLQDRVPQEPNYIKLPARDKFAFGKKDFSLELWAKTTKGGEVLTQSADPSGPGFRLAIANNKEEIRCEDFGEARVQFAITEFDREIVLCASTDPTGLTDGNWHHLCVVRQQNVVTVFIDGISIPTAVVVHRDLFPESVRALHAPSKLFLSTKRVDVTPEIPAVGNGIQPLVVGAYVPAPGHKKLQDAYSPNFHGLIAEVRVWNHGLSAAEVQDRCAKLLTGREFGLVGYWPLMNPGPQNGAHLYADLAGGGEKNPQAIPDENVVGVKKQHTSLKLRQDPFPHLVRAETVEWPYQERWAIGGADAPGWDAVAERLMTVSGDTLAVSGETLAFFSGDHIHAVDLIHGDRLWSLTMPAGRNLVADEDAVYMRHTAPLKENERVEFEFVRALDSKTGAQKWEYRVIGNSGDDKLVSVGSFICIETDRLLLWVENATGTEAGSIDCSQGVGSNLHAGALGLYFGTKDGKLHFVPHPVRDAEGKLNPPAKAATVDIGGFGPITTADGVLFAANGKTVVRLDARTLKSSQNIARDDKGKIITHDHLWQPPSIEGDSIIGMAASPRHNRLVLTTQSGTVRFWEFASGKEIGVVSPPVSLNKMVISAPVINGDDVFLTVGGTNKGADAGAVLAYDLRTGTLRGNDSLKTQPHGRPVMAQGALYFACHSADSEQARPEANAVHSVVFGNEYALNLSGEQNSVITMKDTGNLLDPDDSGPDGHGLSSGNFTLETWVNTPGKGGQLIYSPGLGHQTKWTIDSDEGTKEGSFWKDDRGGFSLTVTPEGDVVAAISNHQYRHTFTAKGTAAADGRWHHLAAVFRQDKDATAPFCELYVDGRRLDSAVVDSADNPLYLATETRSVSIGGTRGHEFQGMLADVRIWGTWLHAEEIASRRSVRLRGDEPDLLANWSFDDGTVHDHSANDFHNESAGTQVVWLTDLHFSAPHYPYLSATSAPAGPPTRKQNADGSFTLAEAVYTTTITARTADGSGRPNTPLTIMTNEKVTISGPSISRETLEPGQTRTVVTDPKGNLKLTLTCNDIIHSPELKLRADFMYTNEWFHVCPAIQNQTMVTLPPPKLTAHCDMIEDLHYDDGDTLGENGKLDEKAQITTIKTTIVATGSNGGPLPFEPIEVWADDHVDIEVDGVTYSVNADNSAQFKTGADGELLITLHENANKGSGGNLLNVPNLVVRAGFMPRSSNFVIHPAEYSLSALENVTAGQLKGEEALPHAENKKSALLTGDNAKNAEEVAKTLQHMMALTKKARPAGVQAAGMTRGKGLTSEARHLNQQFAPADSVESLHHHAHVDIHRPVSPDHMPAPHFVMNLNKNGPMEYRPFHNDKDLDTHLGMNGLGTADTLFACASRFGPDDAAGGWGFLASIASAFEEAAAGISYAVQEVTQVVVRTVQIVVEATKEIVSRVELAIVSAAGAIGTWVINTVKDVADHVVAFIEKIGSAIKDVYNFLKSLFDWKQILEVHDVLKGTISDRLDGIKRQLKTAVPDAIRSTADKVEAALDKVLGVETSHESLNSKAQTSNEHSSKVVSHTKSNKGKHMQEKVEHNSKKASGVPDNRVPDDNTEPHDPDLLDRAKKIGEDLMQVVKSVASPGDLTLDPFKHLMADMAKLAIEVMKDLGLKFVKALDVVFEFVVKGFTAEIHIPFISALYKTLTGNALSLLDVTCLILAVPVNLVLVMTGTKWNKTDAQLGAEGVFAMAGGRHRDAAGAPNGRDAARIFSIFWSVVILVWACVKAAADITGGTMESVLQQAAVAAVAASGGAAATQAVAAVYAPNPVVAAFGFIEAGCGLCAQIFQYIYRVTIDQKWKWAGDFFSFDNLGGLLSLCGVIGVILVSVSQLKKGILGPAADIAKMVCCGLAALAMLFAVVDIWTVGYDSGADWAEFGISMGAGAFGIFGLLGLDMIPQPLPAIALGVLDVIAVTAMIAIHYQYGHGYKAFYGDPEPAAG